MTNRRVKRIKALGKMNRRELRNECIRRQRLIGKLHTRPTWDTVAVFERRLKKEADEALAMVDSRLANMHQNIREAESKMRIMAADNFLMHKKLQKAGIRHVWKGALWGLPSLGSTHGR